MENLQKKIQILFNLYKLKNLPKAEKLNRELLHNYPKVVILYNILGLILTDQKRTDEAIKCYEEGIKIQPDYAMIYNNLGTIYKSKKNYNKAENYYKKSIDLDKKISEPHNNLGNLFLSLNRFRDAIDCYKKALSINPKFSPTHYNIGTVYITIGNNEEARIHLNEAVKLNPYFCIAHRVLTKITKYSEDDKHFIFMKNLYLNPKINDAQRSELGFALGKAYEDIKNFDSSFKYYNKANEFRRKNITFSLTNEKKDFDDIKKIFNKLLFNKFKKDGNSDKTPIFILGMPRSGTTLVEQIISSHPQVYGGDELEILPIIIKKYFQNKSNGIFLKNITNVDKKNFKIIGHEYVSNLKNISGNTERVTDKLPINFKWIGLIKLILPNSKIVHCIRDSRDNCFSIFKNYFANTRLNYAYNLGEICEFYNLYSDLMKHWKNVLPEFIFDIKYEKIIDNPEKEIRSLLKACDLDWDDNCLKFYDNKRPIKTASDTQAREKIYKSSVDSWKNYKKYINMFFNKLTD